MAKELNHIDISSAERKIILSLIETHLPNTTVWAYGSRATWSARPKSDLDLVAFASAEQKNAVYDLKEAFEESDLPFRVDFFVWDNVPDEFRGNIERDRVVLVDEKQPETVPLSTYADVQTGPFGSQLHKKDYVDVGTPIITVEHLGDNKIIHENLPRVSDSDRVRLEKYWMQEGDIIFSRVGSVDRCAYVSEAEDGWLFSGRCLRVRVNAPDHVDSRFLSFYFGQQKIKEHLRQIAVGATMPSLNTTLLSGVKISVPPLKTQKAIAHILGTLDNKIDLNRRMNETLEAMAQAIFKSWFVDFDGCTEFEDSELGRVPKGWKWKPLFETVNLIGGGTPKTKVEEYWNGTIPWYSVVDAPSESDIFLLDTQKKITELGLNNSSTKLLREGTTIVSARGTVGKLALAAVETTMNQSCYGIQGKADFPDYYTYFSVKRMIDDLKRNVHGAVFDTITRDTFKHVYTVVPPAELRLKFEETMQPYLSKIVSNLRQVRQLTSLRDTLLPKLISGEQRVDEAEKMVEEL